MALHINNGPNVFERNLGSQGTTTSTSTGASTSTSAAASPTSSGNGNGGSQGLSITGSPPLIVAFLAVGLFMTAMLTIFGWRRVVFGRGFVLQPIVGDRFHAPRTGEYSYREKPELWDLWTEPPVGGKEQLKWERIMPFSASIKKLGGESFDNAQASDIHTHPRIPSQLQTIRQHIRRHMKPKLADEQKVNAVSTQNRTLQVAVAIAMPSPHKREREPTNEGLASADTYTHEPHDADLLEYSLGLMEMPWHSEEG